MRSLIVAAILLGLAAPAAAAQFREGTYSVDGTNFDGSPYRGTADVRLLSNTTCQIVWHTGSTESFGQCMLMDDVVAAGYVMGESVGLIMYKIQADGSLEGYWTIGGKDGSGTERLTPQ